VRFPIADEWFELELPYGAPVTLHARSAPFAYWSGFATFEPEVVPTFVQLARTASSFVDVGANFGLYSLLARRLRPDAPIAAVEPNPLVADVLEETVRRNDADVRVVRAALADEAGAAELSLAGGLSSLVAERWPAGAERVRVELATFDALFPEGAGLVKIDTEAAELRVLRGMRETLTRVRPPVLCEIARENLAAVQEIARELDYRVLRLPERTPAEAGTADSANYLLEP
jgi:FkbM family methyltransferase